MNHSITLLSKDLSVEEFGGKAANLSKMLRSGLPVPAGLGVGLGAFENNSLKSKSKKRIESLLNSKKLYAVRSSALAEDTENASWAGQFETFLDVPSKEIVAKVEECHRSTKARAQAYAGSQGEQASFDIAVVVQEMVKPEYAGVLFTKNPLTGEDKFVCEYVKGFGEKLVSGEADPERVEWSVGGQVTAPFDVKKLTELAEQAKTVFGSPQDIEWVWANDKLWLVQARPITATQTVGEGFYLGEPDELFYWGPSRAKPLYMSDFMAAAEDVFTDMAKDKSLPTPAQTLVLFHDDKMVWLNNAKAFEGFTEQAFIAYEKYGKLSEDIARWRKASEKLESAKGNVFSKALLQAWKSTIFAEFSLYGAQSSLAKRFERFDPKQRQEIWGAFTVPDTQTFLNRIDEELLESKDPKGMAGKYPWIQDGYDGVEGDAEKYFIERLKTLDGEQIPVDQSKKDRAKLAKDLGLSQKEVDALNLARELAEFMDDRKAWMMQTRRLLKKPLSNIKCGWFFSDGECTRIDKSHVSQLWERYVNFRTAANTVQGVVASNGGRHFINGEAAVVGSPTESVSRDRILVVPSTSPSYVPLMRHAKALITDHGGMMSHAAIVARELNLPCIVGTKQATKVLKTGDQVVLDLVRGEVIGK